MKIKNVLITSLLIGIQAISAQNYSIDKTPQRITLNLTSEPATSMAVTWRTLAVIDSPQVSFLVATDSCNLEAGAISVPAVSETVKLDNGAIVFHHAIVLEQLSPNTTYAYRVGSTEAWSAWNHFTTAQMKNAPFECIFFGDPQNGIKEYVSRAIRQGFARAPDANFWLFVGDLIGRAHRDSSWDQWYAAGDFIFSMVPSIMIPGNHECYYKKDGVRVYGLTPFWKVHFTLPENGVRGLEEQSYFIDYQGVRFIMLNGMSKLDEQSVWMDQVLSDNPNSWTIVSVHQSFYSMGRNRDELKVRKAFLPIIDKHSVDLVLTGHDHVYSRSYKLKDGNRVEGHEKGTTYIISVSGMKAYELTPAKYGHLMAKTGVGIQLFQVISVDGNSLTYKAYTVTGALYDSFVLNK